MIKRELPASSPRMPGTQGGVRPTPSMRETKVAINVNRGLVRTMGLRDLDTAAHLHTEHLSQGFFPRLGERFLRSYYRGFVLSPHAVALVVQVDGRAVGMLVGTTRHATHHRWLLRSRGWQLGWSALSALAVRPRAAAFFARTRAARYVKAAWRLLAAHSRSAPTDGVESTSEVAVLSHVAVAESHRGCGFASALTDAFLDAVRRSGVAQVQVVTNADSGAGGFYKQSGWLLVGSYTNHDGERMETYARRVR